MTPEADLPEVVPREALPVAHVEEDRAFVGPEGEVGPADPVEGTRGEWPGVSTFLEVGDEVFHTYSAFERFLGGNRYLDLTALGRQEAREGPKGRARPLGLQAGGPRMRLPDEYDLSRPRPM